jgi:tRNA(adenine34) deaminase
MPGLTGTWSETDLSFMRAALELAGAAAAAGEVPVGAVVVQDGQILGSGHNRTLTDCDPSAHAEIVALREAAQVAGNHRLTEATLYVTLEPCTMCVGAISEARISRLVFGAYDEKAGACGSRLDLADTDATGHNMEINGGLLKEECATVLREFFEARRDD